MDLNSPISFFFTPVEFEWHDHRHTLITFKEITVRRAVNVIGTEYLMTKVHNTRGTLEHELNNSNCMIHWNLERFVILENSSPDNSPSGKFDVEKLCPLNTTKQEEWECGCGIVGSEEIVRSRKLLDVCTWRRGPPGFDCYAVRDACHREENAISWKCTWGIHLCEVGN